MARILFVMNLFPGMGGVEKVTEALSDKLSENNEIYVAAFDRDTKVRTPDCIKKAFYFPYAYGKNDDENISFYNRLLETLNIDIVINQGIYPILSGIVFNDKRNKNVRIYSVLHGKPGYEGYEYWSQDHVRKAGIIKTLRRKLMCKLGLNRGFNRYVKPFRQSYQTAVKESEKVILLCNGYLDDFCRIYGVDRGKLAVIENPLPSEFTDIHFPDWESKENIILYVGRLSIEKNVDKLLTTWSMIQDRLPSWSFIIAGDGPKRAALEKKSEALQLQRVSFNGYTENPIPLYLKSRILLLASEFEGYPMVLIEAQRCGVVPVVIPISAGVESIINGGGVTALERKEKALADTIVKLAEDKERIKTLSHSAYLKSEKNKIEDITNKWKKLIQI